MHCRAEKKAQLQTAPMFSCAGCWETKDSSNIFSSLHFESPPHVPQTAEEDCSAADQVTPEVTYQLPMFLDFISIFSAVVPLLFPAGTLFLVLTTCLSCNFLIW